MFADGFVVANPKNASYDVLTVTNGTIVLDRPYGVISSGFPTCRISRRSIWTPRTGKRSWTKEVGRQGHDGC